MARIAGIDLPKDKQIWIGLQYIYGIGTTSSQRILADAEVDPSTRIKDISEEQVARIRDIIDKEYKVEGDLRKEVQFNIKRLIEISSYRGLRHRMKLPVHGQKTRTNARTRKGAKKTVAGRGRRRGIAKK